MGNNENMLELTKLANYFLLQNDIPLAIKSFEKALNKISVEQEDVNFEAKKEIDEFLSKLSEKNREIALNLAKKVIRSQPIWFRGWRRWMMLSLPGKFISLLKKMRGKPPIEALENNISIMIPTKIPVVIFTRAYNRLEYTVQCVDGVARQITDAEFIHVVIDQASDDGTEQWFNWLSRNPKPHWAKLGYIRLKQNLGDWGGLMLGEVIIGEKYRRVMQLDNDMQLIDSGTLANLSYALDVLGSDSIVMCRRLQAGDLHGATGGDVPLLPLSRKYKMKLAEGETKIYRVNHSVGCFMASRELIDASISAGCNAACRICESLNYRSKVFKLHDITALHIQGWDGKRYLQHEKYYRSSVSTGMNYLKVNSEEIMNDPKRFIDYTLPPAADSGWLKI